jgi:adenylyl- and sulfurtransferase ThiI
MDIVERLDAAIKTEDFWVGDQREDNILKDSKEVIENLQATIILILDACEDVNSPDRKVRIEIRNRCREALKEKE